jgi:hypothetical protein
MVVHTQLSESGAERWYSITALLFHPFVRDEYASFLVAVGGECSDINLPDAKNFYYNQKVV